MPDDTEQHTAAVEEEPYQTHTKVPRYLEKPPEGHPMQQDEWARLSVRKRRNHYNAHQRQQKRIAVLEEKKDLFGFVFKATKSVKKDPDFNKRVRDHMLKIGLTPENAAEGMKHAMQMSLKSGKIAKAADGEYVEVPDIKTFKELLVLWGDWMKVGSKGEPSNVTNKTINLFGAGTRLSEVERQRLTGLAELLQHEAQRRGLSDVSEADFEAEGAKALQGVVESSPGEEEAAD